MKVYEDKHYRKWIAVISEAISCLDIKNDRWVHLPCSGGYYDQDAFIMEVWEHVRYSFNKASRDPAIIKQLEMNAKQKEKRNG